MTANIIASQLERAISQVSETASHELETRGYTVIDGVFDHDILCSIREEIELLESAEWLQSSPSLLKCGGGKSATVVKQGIRERSLVLRSEMAADEATLSMVPTLASFWQGRDEIVLALKDNCQALSGLTKLDQVKVAAIRNFGCFPVHTDTDPATGRSLSATIYLNEGYADGDAGELRVYEFPYHPTDVQPLFGRMVLFSSCWLLHRVMPSAAEVRFCLSLMFYGPQDDFPRKKLSIPGTDDILVARLMRERRALGHVVYFEECLRSMREGFEDRDGTGDRHGTIEEACNEFSDMCVRVKTSLDGDMLRLLETLPVQGLA